MSKTKKAISLFSGAGGMDKGFSRAEFKMRERIRPFKAIPVDEE